MYLAATKMMAEVSLYEEAHAEDERALLLPCTWDHSFTIAR
jgi:hypothetical protein